MNSSVYWQELTLSVQLGRGLRSKLRLFCHFLGYHVANRTCKSLPADEAPVKTYSVVLGEKELTINLRPKGEDFYVLHEIFGRGLFAVQDELASVMDLSKVRSFVDLGGNVGLVSLYYAALLPSARFVCVEPDKGNFKLLFSNLSWLGDRGVFIEGAAAGTSGFLSFDCSGQSYRKRLSDDGQVKVRAYTIDEIMDLGGLTEIDIIKIDIEGGEKAILNGSLSWLSRTKAVLIELHDDFLEADLRRVLEPLGFNVKRLSVGENFLAIKK